MESVFAQCYKSNPKWPVGGYGHFMC